MSYRRKLQALKYPCLDKYDVKDEDMTRNLVVWLEDTKIRFYSKEQREPLRRTKDSGWPRVFEQYLKDIDLQKELKGQTRDVAVDRLLSFAVRLDYSINADKYGQADSATVQSESQQAPEMVTKNPLDSLNFQSPEFVQGVNSIADSLKIAKHPNHLMTLEAIAHFIKAEYSPEALKNRASTMKSKSEGIPFPLQEIDSGFTTGDHVLNHASKILRLLYISDLRELQTKINECIVAVQSITADPKTDTRLGKVGF